jgi:hypothetical protein
MNARRHKISRAKWEFTFWVSGMVIPASSVGPLDVQKVVMTDFGEKLKITCHGMSRSGRGQPRSVTYNMTGYDTHPTAPEWLIDLVKEAKDHVRPQ